MIRLVRSGPGADAATRALVRAAFAHRRKTLARSLEQARPGSLDAARAALRELGLPEERPGESQLSPASSRALAEPMR